MRKLSAKMYAYRATVRSVVYAGFGIAFLVSFLTDTSIPVSRIALLVGTFAACALAVEALIYAGKPKGRVLLDGSQTSLVRREGVPGFPDMIEEADEVWLLGGTFKTFTDDSRNLEALARFYREKPTGLQILVMHPDGGGLESTARARQARGKGDTVSTLRVELLQSLNRLVDYLGPNCIRQIYTYKEHPTYAMYKVGTQWLLTVYTLGRGASSPAMYFKETPTTAEFCRGLERGFEDVRHAGTTEPVERLPRDSSGHFLIT